MSNDSTLVIDVDGTLCPIKKDGESYSDLVPYPEIISRMREYRELGFRIALSTSRNMRTFDGNLGRINAVTAPQMVEWLQRWDIPYDELYFAKPWPGKDGFYVDDRTVRPDEFRDLSFDQIRNLLNGDRDTD
ncbi:capsular biosynthesis protein [Stenotrophomonas maltophilia]|uniref:Capsular biosynthesis protein n=1 Tax=Stenotrophomonas maltophilia TaxID=40324 RepID=A0A2J0SV84_STEMA|nr:capsular biosynthesis protein [Stenotrophomonas maltophilia]PJL00938.1 capsular biosynthesis protein [Stenotrophomonas maltophilia]PJL27997.1 capsular biosynthesis protein [Stenotrophomonas maltophilia]PJL64788.1 capsular biosynthesis protein [Stenotrophomonas maltophilia]